MRARRGNFALLFVLLSGVLLAMLAFSIDIGRLRAAKVGAENAAEAAAQGALIRLRAGQGRARARNTAEIAANLVASRGLGAGTPATSLNVDLDFGEWHWEQPFTGANSRWEQTPNGSQAVMAHVSTSSGIGLLFGAAFNLLDGENVPPDVTLYSQATAALRNRDIIVLMDVSQMSGFSGSDLSDILTYLVDSLYGLGNPNDRLAIVGYAGDAWRYDLLDPMGLQSSYGTGATPGTSGTVETAITATEPPLATSLYRVASQYAAMRQTASHVMPCFVGSAEFTQAYRFVNPGLEDQELSYFGLQTALNYRLIKSAPNGVDAIPDPNIPFDDETLQTILAFYSGFTGTSYVSETNWNNAVLDQDDQGYMWMAAEGTFLLSDPRVVASLDSQGFRSPLHCYAGNERMMPAMLAHNPGVAETVPEAIVSTIDPLETANGAWEVDPLLRYGDNDTLPEWADLRYFWAGSDPSTGLQEAVDILQARSTATNQGEPVVLIITGPQANCGPNVQPILPGCFTSNIEGQAGALSQQLARMEANVYVIGNDVTSGAQNVFFDTLWQNRGYYAQVSGVPGIQTAIDRFVGDAMIQVVE